ncbi:hypothetical protein L7D45_03080 [Brucella pseudogrignonensis]|nr:hypothetical protein [Brucella pseudogrignonensis]UKK93054.1 hypothetical protein L7D45_03080 [Brucella pseudogrignonensis]
MFGSTRLGEDRCGRFSEAVRRAFRQIGIIAPLAHLVAEPVAGKRLAVFGDKKRRLIMCNRVQRLAKLVRDRQAQGLRIFAGTLFRHEFDALADQVTPSELDEVRASDAQIQHQFHCKPSCGTERVGCAIARHFRFAPGMETGGFMDFGDAVRGIERRQLGADSPIEQRLQILHQLVSRAGRAAALHLASFDVGFADLLERQFAHINAITIEDALLVFLRSRRLALKRLGPIIGLDKPANRAGLQARNRHGFLATIASQHAVIFFRKCLGDAAGLVQICGRHSVLGHAWQAQIEPFVAVPIDIPRAIFEGDALITRPHDQTGFRHRLRLRSGPVL